MNAPVKNVHVSPAKPKHGPREGAQIYRASIRVLLADDSPRVREGIRNMLDSTKDIVIIGEAIDGRQALDLALSLCPDVLLLDMEMPLMNGVQVVDRLQQKKIATRILVLSAYDDLQYILGALDHGASGYLLKEEVPDSLVTAIRGVARGQTNWVSARVSKKISNWRH